MFIIILLFINIISSEYPCTAPPLVYGTTCTSSEFVIGESKKTIIYKITEITTSTNIECYGIGYGYVSKCEAGKWDFYYLGVFKEGDVAELYWGDNDAFPTIKCAGMPLFTTIKWEWTTSFIPDMTVCESPDYCCGDGCCRGNSTQWCHGDECEIWNGCCASVCCHIDHWCCNNTCMDENKSECCWTDLDYNAVVICNTGKCCTNYDTRKPFCCNDGEICNIAWGKCMAE